ncbi:MAG: nitrite reductase (NAD(P)H) small subunit [Candidatus Omnitrophica bacterium]|nr:nitrite reductase (NAD(P)H) small subunit [Candidatus Omnitrophota bacterium]MCB9719504.1 nitrite reductase (NAD(P)H) small subunit [Candidatus Omnitrophota bacterium]
MDRAYIINLGPLEDIAIGQGRCFIVKDTEVAVFRLRDGSVAAIENQCPHRKGPLAEGIIDQQFVVCPLHGHKFDLETGEGEGGECVRVFNTWIEHGNIYMQFSPYVFIDGKITAVTNNN